MKYLLTFDTPNFRFTALGDTPGEVRRMMREAWNKHCEETGAKRSYFTQAGCVVDKIYCGGVNRDGVIFYSAKARP